MKNTNKAQSFVNGSGEYLTGVLSGEDLHNFKIMMANDPQVKKAVNELEISMDSFLGVIASEALRANRNEGQPPDESHDTWPSIAPGITGKVLHYDHMVGAMIYIARLEPGARCLAADDGSPEECMLISGDFSLCNVTLSTGDRYSASESVIHSGGYTDSGAILLIRAQDS